MKLTEKQNEYIRNANHRWNIQIGAARSGKSFINIAYSILANLRARAGRPGVNIILGVSKGTIERNVLKPMREIYTDRIVSTINSSNVAHIGGEEVYCLGAEKVTQVSKIQGSSIKYVYGDEIAKWSPEVFDMIPSRLDREYSCFEGSCNPESPTHWLKAFIDRDDIDSYIQYSTLFDNPTLPPSVVEAICTEYEGTVFYDRLVLGKWTRAEGLVYPKYDNTVKTEPREYAEYAVSMDYGTMNPTAIIVWGRIGKAWYAVKEYYHSGRDTQQQKTDAEYYSDLERLCKDVKTPYGEKLELIVDPSAASFIAQVRKGERFRVRKADNDVINGIRNVSTCLAQKRILFNDCCKHTLAEFGEYAWDDRSVVDAVIKDNDHCMDAVRYFVMTKKIFKDKDYVDFSGLHWR